MSVQEISRFDFLRGRLRKDPEGIRPPGCLPEELFQIKCDGCGDCVSACLEEVLVLDAQDRPILLFGDNVCTFCGDCASACPQGAFDAAGARPWRVKARVTPDCFSIQGIVCMSCLDACEPHALTFAPMTAGRALPMIDEASCTGCGACLSVCPNRAISMFESNAKEAAA